MAHGRDAGAPLMFGLRVRALPGGSGMPTRHPPRCCAIGPRTPATRATGFQLSLPMHGVRGSCLDRDNKDSY